MRDFKLLCLGCMREKTSYGKCPYCGFELSTYDAPAYLLAPETILHGEYLIGRHLGEGGFGITYIAWDLNIEIPLAIKEYFPSGLVTRNVGKTDTVSVFTGEGEKRFQKGMESFIKEARILGKFNNMEGVVSVKHFFEENGTAYIVMEYVDGEDFGHFLKRNGGRLPAANVFAMMKPVIEVLIGVHSRGLIHRDISPDNIMITKDSEVKLLDFGAAREVADGDKSLSVVLKPGYAPEEQYRKHGQQGPWTDVYAMCATMYRGITGKKPIESLGRMQEDELLPPSALGISIDAGWENALMKGMAVLPDNRWQDMKQLYAAIYTREGMTRAAEMNSTYPGGSDTDAAVYEPTPLLKGYNTHQDAGNAPAEGTNRALIIALAILLTVMIGAGGMLALNLISRNKNASSTEQQTESENSSEESKAESKAQEATEAEEEPRVAPVFSYATCSSIRGTDSEAGEYSVDAVLDQVALTKWAPVNSNDGVGEWIQINANEPQLVSGIRISNGYPKDYSTWKKNNRVKDCTLSFSDGTELYVRLADQKEMQTVEFGQDIETTYIRITIDSVYYGTKWDDVAIAEIEAYN